MAIAYSEWQHGQDYQVIDLDDGRTILFITGNHRLFWVSAQLGERLRNGLGWLSPEELDEWNRISSQGIVSDVNQSRLASSSFSDGSNLAINVNLTATCNLSCTYCFADGGDYGRITGKMESEAVDHIFSFIQQHITPTQTVRFEFFGGEPLLNFERIKEICDRSDEMHESKGINFIYRISTNLTALPKGTLELFADKRFIVSVSLDGDEETHNRNRPTKNGNGSFQWIMKNVSLVRKASDDITLVARMTVVGEKPSLVDNVRALWKLNIFDYFQIYPGVVPVDKNTIFVTLGTKDTPGKTQNTVSPTFYQQLAEFADFYPSLFTPSNRFRGVLEYERIADMVINGKLALSYCSGGRNYYTFSPDDSIMPCHRLVGDTEFQLGSGKQGLHASLNDWRLSVDNHSVCSKCWIRYLCGGGCKQENYIATGTLNDPNLEMCKYQIQLTETIIRTIVQQGENYRARNRTPLEDLFVSCGRPIIMSMRREGEHLGADLQHFQVL